MSQRYADIIIDISHEGVDRPFEYKIPEGIEVAVGSVVNVPFGRYDSVRQGIVIGLKDKTEWPVDQLKSIESVPDMALPVEARLVTLAAWMKETYGSTMIQSLKTVMPVKAKVGKRATATKEEDYEPVEGVIEDLVEEQLAVLKQFSDDYDEGKRKTYLLHGVTGSGKTEVYIRMAEKVLSEGKDVIVLVPEIALTYQTVSRFRAKFQDKICILNSRLSAGEKYREFEKAKSGETKIMVGPRSALFAPFQNLGLIIIDEEHDTAYKSEMTPKYHAREVAIKRAELENASVVLGSATPSVESYYKAERGEYTLLQLTRRATGSEMAEVSVVDMREELRQGNRSMISKELYDAMSDAFAKGQQAMLFINRRGYNSFVSCRECGDVMKCPHCDVSLSKHRDNNLYCHYCGYVTPMPKSCGKCGSKLIGGYGVGTEKVEEEVNRLFPDVKTLRMDKDTTTKKNAHGKIIADFRAGKAQCLVGTQMIVKGHDFGKVTVVGNILADLGLFDGDYESSERTFDLLTQAAGRAGRQGLAGHVIIQTYQTEHYAIETAAKQDYASFYEYEMAYRKMLHYPPVFHLLGILITSKLEDYAEGMAKSVAKAIREKMEVIDCFGPSQGYIYRINEVYRQVIYVKAEKIEELKEVVAIAQERFDENISKLQEKSDLEITFDLNPMNII